MNRDKQTEINELAKSIFMNCHCGLFEDEAEMIAKWCYQEMDRKASEVEEEIFAEMREELVRYLMLNENIAIKCKEENGEWNAEYWKGKLSAFKQIRSFIDAELKKKYTEGER